MADLKRNYAASTVQGQAQSVEYDAGLRAYMLGVYNYMAAGVALTGVTAYATANWAMSNPSVAQTIYGGPLKWVIMLAPLGLVFLLAGGINRMSVGAAQITFWVYAAIMGVSLSSIFMIYAHASIAQMFFLTAATFAALSLYGYTTKTNLSAMGSFLFMGLVGIILASVVNWFIGSSAISFAISVLGILIFAGLTAFDTQRIKETYFSVQGDTVAMSKSAIMGALNLYLDFINMFLFMLRLFGSSRS